MPGVLFSLGAAIIVMLLCDHPTVSQTANPPASTSASASASAGTSSSAPSSQIQPAAALVVELTKSIDARKAKPDDSIPARLTMDVLAQGRIVVPRGTKIVGHITAATARSHDGSEARIEVAFDHIVFKNGFELPLQATIRAIGAPLQAAFQDGSNDEDAPVQTATRQPIGPNEWRKIYSTSPPGSRRPDIADGPAVEAGSPGKTVGPALAPASVGIVGIKGIRLTSSARSSAISSTRGSLHLSPGTQLVLRLSEPQLLLDSLQKNREMTRLQPTK